MEQAVPSTAGGDREYIVVITGELDIATRHEIPELVREAISTTSTTQIALDLSGVEFIDCAGLRSVFHARELTIENGRRFHVDAASSAVRRLLDLTETTDVLLTN